MIFLATNTRLNLLNNYLYSTNQINSKFIVTFNSNSNAK